MMILADPFWLVLAFPLAMVLWFWRLPARWMLVLRCLSLTLLLLAVCGLSVLLPTRAGTVVVVADRSVSMPEAASTQQKEAADIVHSAMPGNGKLAVVSFAEKAVVEQSPQAGKFAGFSAAVGRESSNLADALDLALSLIDKGEAGRILVLSDGLWTGRDIVSSAARAAATGVAIDYRPMQRSSAGDLAVERIQGPESVTSGESFMISAWIQSPLGQWISFELTRGTQVIGRGTQAVPAGVSRLMFRDTAGERGVAEYVLRVQGELQDPIRENNTARLLVGIRGNRPLLFVSPSPASGLADLLAKGGIEMDRRLPQECRWTLEELGGYSAVLLENTQAGLIGQVGMETLAAWVSETGGGLMMTGGKNSYGPGGYYKSPLEPLLPVSIELRQEHRKLALAIVVALDCSGSMAVQTSDGRPKIELADLAAAEVVEMLGALDQFGCFAVNTAAQKIVPLADVVNRNTMRNNILRIRAGGNGIYIEEALAAAGDMIRHAKAGTKHIVMFADARDSRQHPGDYKKLADKCAEDGISISVIGLGTEKDCDADLLKEVASRGNGQCFFTESAEELPRLFVQDTFVIARSAFLDAPVQALPTGGIMTITQQPFGQFPRIGGYNLCYERPGANTAMIADDEYGAPILAAWPAGLGRVLCYTGEADGQYTGEMAGWEHAGEFFTSLARWTVGKTQGFGKSMVATQELRNGVCRVVLHLDPDRESTPFDRLPELTTLSARPGQAAESSKTRMTWATADTLRAEVPLAGNETSMTTIDVPGLGQATLAPMCLPYSPEYQPAKAGQGVAALERLAKATGGSERLDLSDIWKEMPKRTRWMSLTPPLLLAAVVVFLLEVFQRRTGFFSMRWIVFLWARIGWIGKILGKAFGKVVPRFPKKAIPAAAPVPASSTSGVEQALQAAMRSSASSKAARNIPMPSKKTPPPEPSTPVEIPTAPGIAMPPVTPAAGPTAANQETPPTDKSLLKKTDKAAAAPDEKQKPSDMLDALTQAQERARRRTGRE